MRPEHRDQLGEDCFPPHRRSPRSKSRTRRQSRRGTLYYSGARCDYSAKDVRLCIPSPRSLGGLPQPTSDSLRGCRAESWAWRSCTEFPSPAIRRGRPNRLRDRFAPSRLRGTGREDSPMLPMNWRQPARQQSSDAVSLERETEYRSFPTRSQGSHRSTVSGLRTRIGSAPCDDRLGCEKTGPSRKGDKRPASGLDINLARKCCPAGIERDRESQPEFRAPQGL